MKYSLKHILIFGLMVLSSNIKAMNQSQGSAGAKSPFKTVSLSLEGLLPAFVIGQPEGNMNRLNEIKHRVAYYNASCFATYVPQSDFSGANEDGQRDNKEKKEYDSDRAGRWIQTIAAKIGNPKFRKNPAKKWVDPINLLGRDLHRGEVAVVGWSDGKSEILLNDQDFKKISALSDHQKDFIQSLYTKTDHALDFRDYNTFVSLPKEMQDCLQVNYMFTNLRSSWWKYRALPTATAIIGLSLIAMGKENAQNLAGASKDLVSNTASASWSWAKYLVTTPIKFGLTYTIGAALNLLSRAANKASSWTTWDIG